MDPITLALATFGIQKLRGKSTKRSFRDALIAGGIGQFAGTQGVGKNWGMFKPEAFGQVGQMGLTTGSNIAQGGTLGAQFGATPVGKMIGQPATEKIAQSGTKMGGDFIPGQAAKAATGIRAWSPAAKLGAG